MLEKSKIKLSFGRSSRSRDRKKNKLETKNLYISCVVGQCHGPYERLRSIPGWQLWSERTHSFALWPFVRRSFYASMIFLSLSLYLSVNSFVVVELLRRNSIYIFGWHGGHTNLFFDVLALLVSAAVLGQIQHKDSELRFHRPVPLVGYSTVQQEHSTPFLVQRHTIKFVMWFDATDGGLVSICSFLLLYS